MTRNWEVIREILLRLERAPTPNTVLNSGDLSEFPEQEVAYNMRLLSKDDYIEASILESSTGNGQIAAARAKCLTNSGHELLDVIRDDSIWSQIKNTAAAKGVEMTIDVVMMAGKAIMRKILDS